MALRWITNGNKIYCQNFLYDADIEFWFNYNFSYNGQNYQGKIGGNMLSLEENLNYNWFSYNSLQLIIDLDSVMKNIVKKELYDIEIEKQNININYSLDYLQNKEEKVQEGTSSIEVTNHPIKLHENYQQLNENFRLENYEYLFGDVYFNDTDIISLEFKKYKTQEDFELDNPSTSYSMQPTMLYELYEQRQLRYMDEDTIRFTLPQQVNWEEQYSSDGMIYNYYYAISLKIYYNFSCVINILKIYE